MDPSMAVETPTPGMNGANKDFLARDIGRDLNREVPFKGLVASSTTGISGERGMTPNLNSSDNLFVANLQAVSLEKLVKSKLEVLFQQQRDANIELSGLYDIVLEQVEKPLIELALQSRNGNQVKTALLLGINRNTLKKKIDSYKIRIKRASQKDV
jgi:Fis family transcriptional regulator, factor for inversion stimulation protein